MNYLSVCSGIEAASVAWHGLGWSPVAFSEIEAFPSAVLKHRFPDTPNWGDMTKYEKWPDAPIDLICGGTPCQSFSVAGLRKGLDDERGNLMLTFGHILAKYRPRWFVWENVPGVLSSDGGRDFASFLGLVTGQSIEPPTDGWRNSGAISGIDSAYGIAYRVLDAQYTRSPNYPRAVPQRRRRVFVVGHLGDWRRAAAVLLDSEGVSRNPPPSRKARERTPTLSASGAGVSRTGGASGQEMNGNFYVQVATNEVWDTLQARDYKDICSDDAVQGGKHVIMKPTLLTMRDGCEGGGKGPLLQIDKSGTLATGNNHVLFQPGGVEGGDIQAIPISTQNALGRENGREDWPLGIFEDGDPAPTLSKSHSHAVGMAKGQAKMQVRRLTPVECERLQGFPDGWTDIPYRGKPNSPDGQRYKAIGNSMATNVMGWLGRRIQMVDEI